MDPRQPEPQYGYQQQQPWGPAQAPFPTGPVPGAPRAPRRRRAPLFLLLVVIVALVGGGGYWFFLRSKSPHTYTAAATGGFTGIKVSPCSLVKAATLSAYIPKPTRCSEPSDDKHESFISNNGSGYEVDDTASWQVPPADFYYAELNVSLDVVTSSEGGNPATQAHILGGEAVTAALKGTPGDKGQLLTGVADDAYRIDSIVPGGGSARRIQLFLRWGNAFAQIDYAAASVDDNAGQHPISEQRAYDAAMAFAKDLRADLA
jgi:hypothetical protein